jgi:hypothetical protein
MLFVCNEYTWLYFFADLVCFENYTIADDWNLGGFRNLTQKNVAAFPACASGGIGERFTLFNDFRYEEASGYDDEVVDLVSVVVQEMKFPQE